MAKGAAALDAVDRLALKADFMERYRLRGPKEDMTRICGDIGITRQCLMKWLEEDSAFARQLQQIDIDRTAAAHEIFVRSIEPICEHLVNLAMGNTKAGIKAALAILEVVGMTKGRGQTVNILNKITTEKGSNVRSIEDLRARKAEIVEQLRASAEDADSEAVGSEPESIPGDDSPGS